MYGAIVPAHSYTWFSHTVGVLSTSYLPVSKSKLNSYQLQRPDSGISLHNTTIWSHLTSVTNPIQVRFKHQGAGFVFGLYVFPLRQKAQYPGAVVSRWFNGIFGLISVGAIFEGLKMFQKKIILLGYYMKTGFWDCI